MKTKEVEVIEFHRILVSSIHDKNGGKGYRVSQNAGPADICRRDTVCEQIISKSVYLEEYRYLVR